jgi:metal transporter CNNM
VGEIVPQALCTGPNQMKIASFLAPFTYLLMWITYPISYPIALFMDYVIGVQGKSRFCNSDLKSIIELHMKELMGNLNDNQIGYFTGFLDVVNKKIGELIMPMEKVTKINYQANLNKVTINRLIESGYSRIPVYKKNPNNLIGILRMKELVGKDLSKSYTLEQLGVHLTHPIKVYDDTLFLDLFEKFKGGKSHMAFIYKKEKLPDYFHSENIQLDFNKSTFEKDEAGMKIIGIITLEDLIEFWLKIPIMDEEDYLHIRGRSRSRSRRRSIFDIMINSNLQNRLNQLYDSTRSSNRANTKRQDKSLILNNNYQQMNDQNDEETEKLNPK